MADLIETLKQMKELIDSGAISVDQLNKFLHGASIGGVQLTKALSSAGKEVKKLGGEMTKAEQTKFDIFIDIVRSRFEKMADKVRASGADVASLTARFGALVASASGLSKIPQQFIDIGNEARNAGMGATDMGKAIERIGRLGGQKVTGNVMFKAAQNMMIQADAAKNLENQFIRNAAAAGELSRMYDGLGVDMSGLERSSVAFAEQTFRIAQASGLSMGEVSKYANQLSKIPGAMETVIKTGDGVSKNMHMLDAAMKVAYGTGQGMTEVLDFMNTSFRNVGLNGREAVEAIASIGAVSASTGLPIDLVRSYTKDAAAEFKVFGNNTQDAINILGQFGIALKDSGIGPEGIREVARAFTSGIKNMDIAQKAFIATQMGSRGLLSGAFEIDLKLQQGKLDEIANSVRETMMEQFGGRIVSLEEAAQDEAAASQMALQVQMLRQGPLGQLAQTTEGAYRVLEMFTESSTMTADQLKDIGDPEKSMKKALTVGEKLQERQVNVLTQMLNKVDRLTALTAIQTYRTVQEMGGVDVLPDKVQAALGIGGMGMEAEGAEAAALGPKGEAREKIIGGTGPGAEEALIDTAAGFGESAKDLAKVAGALFAKLTGEIEEYEGGEAEKQRDKGPGAIEKQVTNVFASMFGIGSLSKPPEPGQKVAGAMPPARRRTPGTPGAQGAPATPQLQPVKVNVTSTWVCPDCHARIINDAVGGAGESPISIHTGQHKKH